MDKDEDSYPSATNTAASMTTFANLDHFHREYLHHQQQHQQVVQEQQQQPADPAASSSSSLIVGHHEGYFGHGVHHHDRADRVGHDDGDNNNNSHETANMAAAGDYMLSHSSATALKPPPFDRLSFADVMQFADFGPKLALNHHHYRHQQLLPAINKAINHADEVEQLQEEIDPINHNPRNDRGHYDNNNLDPHVYFLKFPVLGDRPQDSRHEQQQEEVELQQLIHGELGGASYHDQLGAGGGHGSNIFMSAAAAKDVSNNNNNPAAAANAALVDFQLLGENNRNIRDFDDHKSPSAAAAAINTITTTTAAHDIADPMIAIIKNMSTSSNNNNNVKRKRPRSVKTSEEVESQRMTHIAVERNRRKQMNEHLRVLRSLMPTSYVQRGDQASIIGGAIEFVRELEQLLQCLESQKRRRLFGTADHQPTAAAGTTAGVGVIIGQQLPPRPLGDVVEDPSSSLQGIQKQHEQQQQQQHPPIFLQFPPMLPPPPYGASGTAELNNSQQQQQQQQGHQAAKLVDLDIMSTTGSCMREETAESKSCIADVEVKMLGFDALIKILSRRRPGQLIKVIAALEDLQFNILHTNITTIEQTVLYSFNVKVASESVFTAEEIASSVQHIFTFIHANSNTN